jgi:flavin-dependent dehydrogenase
VGTTTTDSTSRADVAIIGGGPAGASTALALARAGLKAVIIERLDAPRRGAGETLPPRIRHVLGGLGLWSEFEAAGHVPSVGNRSAWGNSNPSDYDFIFSPYGSGWHLDRQRFDEMLLRAAERAGAILLRGTKLLRPNPSGEIGWRLELAGTASINARFVVDASGRASAFARRCGASRRSFDQMIGVVAYLETDMGAQVPPVTLVEAVEEGWWYSAPLPRGKLVIAYMTDADLASKKELRVIDNWRDLLCHAEHTRERVESGKYSVEAPPRIVSSNSSCLTSIASPSWLAVGDAAATYDPLSSQGIITALSAGIDAAKSIRAYLGGRSTALRDYAGRVRKEFTGYMANRKAYYSLESRWPNSPFWRRRR